MTITNKQKALIHVAKAKTGMQDDAYRELLAAFGVQSSKDLTPQDFESVMSHFKTLGFHPASQYRKPAGSKARLLSKIAAIRADMNLSEKYVNGMAKRMFKTDDGEPIRAYSWLNARQLHRLVAALTYHQRRKTAQ